MIVISYAVFIDRKGQCRTTERPSLENTEMNSFYAGFDTGC